MALCYRNAKVAICQKWVTGLQIQCISAVHCQTVDPSFSCGKPIGPVTVLKSDKAHDKL